MEDKAIYRTGNEDDLEFVELWQELNVIRLDYTKEAFAKAIKKLYKQIVKDL